MMDSQEELVSVVESPKVVEGGLQKVIERKFVWRLNHFDTMIEKADTFNGQKFHFDVTINMCKPGCWTSWEVFMEQGEMSIGGSVVPAIDVRYRSLSRSSDPFHEYTQLQLEIFDPTDEKLFDQKSIMDFNRESNAENRKIGLGYFADEDTIIDDYNLSLSELPVQEDGSLVLNLTWRCWLQLREGVVVSDESKEINKKYLSLTFLEHKLAQEFGKALEQGGGNSDVKLVSSDGKEFKAHRSILGVRSPVFLAMFSSDMKESKVGEVKIDDVASAAMKFMLHYVYTGSLLPFTEGADLGPEQPNIDEVLYVAEKYQLKELVAHFDETLGLGCGSPQDLLGFFQLAKKYSLEKAVKRIRDQVWNNPEVRAEALKWFEETL